MSNYINKGHGQQANETNLPGSREEPIMTPCSRFVVKSKPKTRSERDGKLSRKDGMGLMPSQLLVFEACAESNTELDLCAAPHLGLVSI
ncbi:hypothetical protein HZA56_05445 [Candidatus Poribacteria bacterium]|nr:hypothetical protein [Candidatus Poribacteria bacterium]